MKGLRYGRWAMLVLVFFVVIGTAFVRAQVEERIDTREKRDVILYRGDLVSLKVYSLTRIAISTPGIVDIVNADVDEILLVGNALGQTQIFIWDEYGKRSVLARVMEEDMDMIRERIEQLLKAAKISGITMEYSAYESKIIATGKVNKSQKEVFDKVISEFSEYVINMVDAQGDLIQIDAQITELSKTLTETLGVQWTNVGTIEMTESSGPTPGIRDMFRVVNMDRQGLVTATINAMLETSEARTLSRPSLVMSDGETASITVGGEIPIISSVTTDTSTTDSTTYKSYGITFSVTPEIKDNEKVDITLNVSISDPDGTQEGAFLTTSTQTKVLLDDGQTIIIAGLIKKNESVQESRVPFLSSIPIVGALFRWKEKSFSPDREIVISLTPYIRRQSDKLKTVREREEAEQIKKRLEEQAVPKDMQSFDVQEKKWDTLDEKEIEEIISGQGEPVEQQPASAVAEASAGQDLDTVLNNLEQAARQSFVVEGMDNVPAVITEYAKGVQEKIAQKISFPYQAKEAGWEGEVVLSLTILSDGTLDGVSVKQSSGYSVFDSDASNTAEIVAPYQPFPVEMEMAEITISIPVTYRQDAFLVQDVIQ